MDKQIELIDKAWYELNNLLSKFKVIDPKVSAAVMKIKAAIDYKRVPEDEQFSDTYKRIFDPQAYEESKKTANPESASTDLDNDPVHPTHYQSYYKDGLECIDAMRAAFGEIAVAHFCACNAFKYLWRHSSKGQMEDINKALWYLNKYKEINRIDMGG